MLISLKKYVIDYVYKVKTKVDSLDKDFYDEDVYLIDLEE